MDLNTVLNDFLSLFAKDIVMLRRSKAQFVTCVSTCPKVSDFARYLATKGTVLTNQLHEVVRTDLFGQQLTLLCNGKNDLPQIVEHIVGLINSGVLSISQCGISDVGASDLREGLLRKVGQELSSMASLALFIS